jgi:magnesium chelatase family protein
VPLLDRIELHIELPGVPYQELRGRDEGTGSEEMRARVEAARARQAIADLGGSEALHAKRVAEAVQYRSLDRSYWC